MIYEAKIVVYTLPLEAENEFRAKIAVAEIFRQFIEVLNLSKIHSHTDIQVRRIEDA